jgi:DNA (cytosine-5)-methyltransferase 1
MALGADNPWLTKRFTVAKSRKTDRGDVTVLELCAGASGQALGFEWAGHEHLALVEMDKNACATLKLNRPDWRVIQEDLNNFDASQFKGVDVVSRGLPRPPFSIAGKQLGHQGNRNLFPA